MQSWQPSFSELSIREPPLSFIVLVCHIPHAPLPKSSIQALDLCFSTCMSQKLALAFTSRPIDVLKVPFEYSLKFINSVVVSYLHRQIDGASYVYDIKKDYFAIIIIVLLWLLLSFSP